MNKTGAYFVRSRKTLIPTEASKFENEKPICNKSEERSISSLNSSIRLKYYFQWFLVLFVHFVVFWYLPSKSNNASQGHYYCEADSKNIKCNEVKDNWSLIIFYLLYCLYFYYSALQIRYGYPELMKGNLFTKSPSAISKLGFQIFRAIPFLLELKIFTDWSFTRTGLDVFQWIKFENIYGDLFIAK